MSRYYEAVGETKKRVQQWIKDQEAAMQRAHELAKEFGADGFTHSRSILSRVVGFIFKDESKVDKKLFRKSKRGGDWVPRQSCKAGKDLQQRLQKDYRLPGGEGLAKAIGMEAFSGYAWRTPGMHVVGRRILLVVPDDVEPKGCERVSDVRYEKLMAGRDSHRGSNGQHRPQRPRRHGAIR